MADKRQATILAASRGADVFLPARIRGLEARRPDAS
jgi:hypothetical protein